MATSVKAPVAEKPKTSAPTAPPLPSVNQPAAPTGGRDSFFKVVVWLMVLADLAGAGFWAYMHFGKNRDLSNRIAGDSRQVVQMKTNLVNLESTVRKIAQENINAVDDPSTVVVSISRQPRFEAISEYIQVGRPSGAPFGKSSYYETAFQVVFLLKTGYKFGDLIAFLMEIEKANPTIQIKEMDFGKRDLAVGADSWRPTHATVRVMTLKSNR